ncbi:MAG: hypothetical protein ACKVIR_05115 [Candidatus Poseidoniales archaeon]
MEDPISTMLGVKCVSCGSIGAIQIACSRCKDITYCKVCEPELESERIEQRLCEICYQNIIQENERREFEEGIITVYEEQTRLFENIKYDQSALEESIRMIRPSDVLVITVIFTVIGTILFHRTLYPRIQILCLVVALCSIYAYFEGRRSKAEKLAKLNQIKSNKLFSDYSKKETEEWIYNKVCNELIEYFEWEEEELCQESLELENDENKMIRMTIKKVIKSLE